MIGSLCPACGHPLPQRDTGHCPACGAALPPRAIVQEAPRSKSITHPIVGGTIELPIVPQVADSLDVTNVVALRERSQLYTWVGCMGAFVAILGAVGLGFALFYGPYLAIIGAFGLLLGSIIAFLYFRRSLRIDRAMERESLDLAQLDFHHFEG